MGDGGVDKAGNRADNGIVDTGKWKVCCSPGYIMLCGERGLTLRAVRLSADQHPGSAARALAHRSALAIMYTVAALAFL